MHSRGLDPGMQRPHQNTLQISGLFRGIVMGGEEEKEGEEEMLAIPTVRLFVNGLNK
jgi:hypothetical protein